MPDTTTETALEIVGASYTPARIALVKATVAQDTSDDELAMFLSVAQSRDLDPFVGEIHAIVRGKGDKRKMTIQTGIGGYRKIADRTGLVEWVGEQEFTGDGVAWVAAWVADSPPVAARFTIQRKDRMKPETRTVLWSEYVQTNYNGDVTRMWQEKPCTMLGKVAEATALRAAFPNHLNGLYVDEEMGQADQIDVVQVVANTLHPVLADHLDGFDPDFLAGVDLDAAAAHAGKGKDELRQSLRVLTARQAEWFEALDAAADAATVDDGLPDAEPLEEVAAVVGVIDDYWNLLTVGDIRDMVTNGDVVVDDEYGDPIHLFMPTDRPFDHIADLEAAREAGPRKGVATILNDAFAGDVPWGTEDAPPAPPDDGVL